MKLYLYYRLIIIFVLLTGLTIAAFSYSFLTNKHKTELEHHFLQQTNMRIDAINQAVRDNLAVLRAVNAFYYANKTVSKQQFFSFSQQLIKNNSTIQAIEWIPKVSYKGKNKFEIKAHLEGYKNYIIKEYSGGKMRSAKPRDFYYPVYYIYPFNGNQKALAYDLGSEKYSYEALMSASRSGALTMTAPVRLVQSAKDQKTVAAVLPIYHSPKVRFRNHQLTDLLGYVSLVFKMDILVEQSLGYFDDMNNVINISVKDRGEKIAFYNAARKLKIKSSEDNNRSIYSERVLGFGSRQWVIQARAVYLSLQTEQKTAELIALVLGVVFSFMFAFLMFKVLRAYAQVAATANKKSKALKAATLVISNQDKLLKLNKRKRKKEVASFR